MALSVRIDTSFVVPLLNYISKPSKDLLREVCEHEAAKRTYSHAIRFRNTEKKIRPFWQGILQGLSKDSGLKERVRAGLEYFYNEKDAFASMLKDLQNYFPEGTDIGCNLYTILGYDIGFVSEGQAILNLGHNEFERDPREIFYMAMHELHHVVYTAFNSIFDFSHVYKTEQLVDIIRYCAHMEGLAVYSTLEQRRATGALNPVDYQVLLNKKQRNRRVSDFFQILTRLDTKLGASVQDKDWRVLDQMSGKKRLWYITGAHMAETIDKKLGRETLNETIRLGHENFFKVYHEAF